MSSLQAWMLPRSLCRTAAICLVFLDLKSAAIKLEIMVTSRWKAFERRQTQRRVLGSCRRWASEGHDVELLFFMGDLNQSDPTGVVDAEREQAEFGDLVVVGGPDTDPPVPRDATYVLDRPCARTYRLAYGSSWLAQHRPELDFVMYLDDDSFLHLPRLLGHLERHTSASLAMGYVMETNLDWSGTHICELCDPCEPCRSQAGLQDFCKAFPEMAFGGCVMAVQNCQIFNDGDDLEQCVREKRAGIQRLAQYFGSNAAPRWFLGMGWVFGRRIVSFLGRNAGRLKVRGAADVSLGFWLAPMEGVSFVPMNSGEFHDHPGTRSTFAAQCTEHSVLVHRMSPARWAADFDAERCELTCNEPPGGSD
uniref:Hexosyltransferase n=1 Tax=Alexandrium catenella TaxID=2925 RepID=A0A7S1Q9S7_ALECA|mmetsp:Transcript_23847/g.64962  ORF Transcript_23847/g.64962 Transcript_23847/m.64962 type:complete len:364 (+) Transcript_23847:65-1156(+)